jgi:putative transposase
MPQSLCQNYVHIVFSTKDRVPLVQDAGLRTELFRYLGGLCREHESPPLEVGGVADHVHLLVRLGKSVSVAELVRDLKRASSHWIKPKSSDPYVQDFHWQAGYGAFSLSPSHLEAAREYVRNQEEHHRQESFQDELRRLCRKYGIEIDERFAWD